MVPFVPLWCKSNYSFLEGASHPEELVEQACTYKYPALALTDRNGLYGVVRAHVAAQESETRVIVGSQVRIEDRDLLLLVQSFDGYQNLCRLLSLGHSGPHGNFHLAWSDLDKLADGLIALWWNPVLWSKGHLDRLARRFAGRLYAMITRHLLDRDPEQEYLVRSAAKRLGIATVAAIEVLYHDASKRPLQDVLTCIRHGVPLFEASAYTKANDRYVLPSPQAIQALYADDPDSLARTLEVAHRCRFRLSQLHYRYPVERGPDGRDAKTWLRALTIEGAKGRYQGTIPPDVLRQLDRELRLITELEYEGYFLTMYEIVEFCRKEDILCQGRGSAANSAVCYCLGITAVDPVRSNLLFERFLSKERQEPPDIDLDISHERREEVIQHVYERFGRKRAAMVASVIRYRPRSAIRDVGKALGIPILALEHLAKLTGHHDLPDDEALQRAGLPTEAHSTKLLLRLAAEILGTPRHLSTHPGGFLLGAAPLDRLVPTQTAAMEGRTIIQWDKYDVEAMGLFKVDLLGLGALTLLSKSFALLGAKYDIELDMARIPAEDPRTFDMLCRADTVGVFQVESRAQMAMLPRLKPRRFYDLVIEISLVRPGPIAGQMVHPYLRRRAGLEQVRYPHPDLEPVLSKTLGVPLFQEQVMRLAMVAADYTPGEADQLRRDMAAWRKQGSMDRHRERLVSGMMAKGIPTEFALQVFEQIQGFGEYGFPESHAASFALISYATAWIKCHYPALFACALLNAQPLGFYSIATIVEDARRHDVTILGVDVRYSDWDATLEPISEAWTGPRPASNPTSSATSRPRPAHRLFALRMGLRSIKGLSATTGRNMARERKSHPFASIENLAQRCRLDRKELAALAQSGALSGLKENRRTALWEATSRFDASTSRLPLASQSPRFTPLTAAETILWDHLATAHSPQGHLLVPLRGELARAGLPDAATAKATRPGSHIRYVGLVICRQRPSTASGMVFATLEDETGFVDVVFVPDVYQKYQYLIRMSPILGISGILQHFDGAVSLLAESVWKPTWLVGAKPVSRNFK